MQPSKSKEESVFSINKIVNQALGVFFKDAIKVAFTNPAQAAFFVKTYNWQRKANKLRQNLEAIGLHVPPILVISVTSQCNLHCEGCYHQALRKHPEREMSDERLSKLLYEAKELGISMVILAGGEPLMRKGMLELTAKLPEMLFLMFTNGLLLNDQVLEQMAKNKNVVPMLSMEGYKIDTDGRRGTGVYDQLLKSIGKLSDRKLFWGASLTLSRSNFNEATDEAFIKQLVDSGCKLFFLTEFTPVSAETQDWKLTPEQKNRLLEARNSFREKFKAMFIALPLDEDEIGGCLSAGRGFVHISSEGNVEPCPFIAYSDTNLRNLSLREALQSKMLKTIRDNHDELKEIHGCALWEKREWVQSLAKAAKTDQPQTKE
jgi:MoaA/NifB/PqqE/SkfB family radical SAM enzyme